MTTEQITKSEEQEETTEELVSKGLASKGDEPVLEEAEEEEEEKEEVVTFKTQAELDQYVEDKAKPIAQGMKDKELKPTYDEIQTLKGDKSKLEARLSDNQEDSKLGQLEKAELAEHGDAVEVRDFQDARRDIIKVGRTNRDKNQELENTASRLEQVERQQNAYEKALKLFLPEDQNFISDIEAFAEKLSKVDTQKEMDLLYELEETRIKAIVKAEPKKRTKPDTNLPSAPGGRDLSKASAEDKVTEGLRRQNKKGG